MPTVSVIIPAYNQARYLGAAIRSVLEQSHQDFELIVVDDGSTDETASVCGQFDDARIRYLYQDNAGLSAARNTGLHCCQGAYITFLDADDLFLPDKLRLLLDRMEADPALGLVAGQAIPIDEDGCQIGKVFDQAPPADASRWLLANPLHVGSVLLRREWQERVGFFDESLRSYEDWDYWLRLALAGCPMGWVDQPVSLYRFHTRQMTRNGEQMTQATFAVLDKVFSRPDLPPSWLERRNEAYASAHLRAAAQAYLAQDFARAQQAMADAVRSNPRLLEHDARELARRVAAWADSPKISRPLDFLESIYTHLPPELAPLARRRNRDLARAALQKVFEARRRGDVEAERHYLMWVLRYQPSWLWNRGVLALALRHGWRALRMERI
ncbi:MAG: hypothetical protein KatS3mg050_0892 [Litorilinea sp.]|nr:MAG: hypothetical protein KatS3mg050_0892 [Litorilinea sp.]